jgi:hypothetical protein
MDSYLRMDDLNFFRCLLIFAVGLPDRAELGRRVGVEILVGCIIEALEEEGPLGAMAIEVCVLAVDGLSFGPVVVRHLASVFTLLTVVFIVESICRQVEFI